MWVKTKIGDNGKGGKAMKEMIKRTAVVSIITSLIFAVLGIVMIANPEAAIEIVAAVLGITVIVIGAEKIISYFVMKGNLDFFNYELIYGNIIRNTNNDTLKHICLYSKNNNRNMDCICWFNEN